MKEKVTDIICDVLKLTADELALHADDSTVWDSLMKVEIIFAIEDELDIRFDKDDFARLATPKDLFAVVEEKAGEA